MTFLVQIQTLGMSYVDSARVINQFAVKYLHLKITLNVFNGSNELKNQFKFIVDFSHYSPRILIHCDFICR